MINFLCERIFGPFLPVFLICAGIFLTFRLRGTLLRRPAGIIRSIFTRAEKNEKSPFIAVALSLAGTLGVGNITGVAAAIKTGGPGAVFWMWAAALAAMPVRYSEIVLSVKFCKTEAGAADYIRLTGKAPTAAAFSALCVAASFTIGNTVQVNAAAEAVSYMLPSLPPIIVGIAFALTVLLVTTGGYDRVGKFSAVVIPVLSLGYVLLSLAVIIPRASELPSIISLIVSSAFHFESAAGGIAGFLCSSAVRVGVSRGILSNEAGCGTASYAHGAAGGDPARRGCFGLFEVFADTILMCSLTAFTILLSPPSELDGTALAIESFSAPFGAAGEAVGIFIALSTAVYALASVVCWSHYGVRALTFFPHNPIARRIYLPLFSAACVTGAVMAHSEVWKLADLSVAMMTVLNSSCVCASAGYVAEETLRFFGKKHKYGSAKRKGRSAA